MSVTIPSQSTTLLTRLKLGFGGNNVKYGQELCEFIGRHQKNNGGNLSAIDLKKLYSKENFFKKAPTTSTITYYMKKRLGLSYRKKTKIPENRNSEKVKRWRFHYTSKLIKALLID